MTSAVLQVAAKNRDLGLQCGGRVDLADSLILGQPGFTLVDFRFDQLDFSARRELPAINIAVPEYAGRSSRCLDCFGILHC